MPNVLVIDEFNFVADTDVILATQVNYGRSMIAMSSTHGTPNTHNNPLPAMSVGPTDRNGHPTLRAVFLRRCAPCIRLRKKYCPHMPFSVPWQRHTDVGDQEHDIDLVGPGGPLLSSKARTRIFLGTDIGPAVEGAPVTVGIDPGGGRSLTAGVALRLHTRGVAVVGLLGSTREAGQHLADAALFVVSVAEQVAYGCRVVVYIENNMSQPAAEIVAKTHELMAQQHASLPIIVAREPGQPVSGFTTTEKVKLWFADMLHAWVDQMSAVSMAAEKDCVLVLGSGNGEPRLNGHAGAYAEATAQLRDHLGNVQMGPHGPVFKQGAEHTGHDDLFIALGAALRMMAMAAPDYAGAYSARPGATPGARITGYRVITPPDMANLYAHGYAKV